jgi:hypothetical protein
VWLSCLPFFTLEPFGAKGLARPLRLLMASPFSPAHLTYTSPPGLAKLAISVIIKRRRSIDHVSPLRWRMTTISAFPDTILGPRHDIIISAPRLPYSSTFTHHHPSLEITDSCDTSPQFQFSLLAIWAGLAWLEQHSTTSPRSAASASEPRPHVTRASRQPSRLGGCVERHFFQVFLWSD